jgi:predicted component of type VI protein secretion system
MSFVLGDTTEDLTGQFKICLGKLSKARFYDFQPGGDDYRELVHLVGLYTHKRLGFTLELSLAPGQAARMRVSDRQPIGRLGRSIWLGAPGEDQTTVTIPAEYAG